MLRPRLVAASVLVVAWMVGGWRPLTAQQQVTGTVRDSTSRLAIAGAVVTGVGRDGAVVATALTNERGTYRLLTTGTLPTRLRVVGLGFRPVEADMPAARTEVVQLDFVMLRIPYELQPVRVTAGASCPQRSDRRAALALLEQARAGLLATVVARSDKAARMKRLSIERRLDPRTGRVMQHTVRIDSISRGITAFGAARGARDFIRDGFTEPDSAGGAVFFAPDADVLLDDEFAGGYCFHIMERDRARANQVGLGFKAADRKRDRIDVDGALWIDTVARALVDLQFRYVGLDRRLDALDPGGRVAFREMANGVVLIDRWMLRLVGEEPQNAGVPPEARRVLRRTPTTVPLAVAETGGELARATWQDGRAWNGPLGTLRLRVMTDGGQPAIGTLVWLDDTDYQATTDSSGDVEIIDLAPGPYSARIADPRLEAIGITLATDLSFVAARDSVVERDVAARTVEHYVAQRCEALRPTNGHSRADVQGEAAVAAR